MADDPNEGVMFDRASARKIADTVREVRGTPGDGTGSSGRTRPPGDETVWAKLRAAVGTDPKKGWDWDEVYRKAPDPGASADAEPTWELKTGGRKSDHTKDDPQKNLAYELVPGSGKDNATVLLRRCPTLKKGPGDDDPPLLLTGWQIVAPIPGAGKVKCVDDRDNNDIVSCKTVADSGAVVGDPFDVQVIRHTLKDDVFWASTLPVVSGQPKMLQASLPPTRGQFMVLSILDATGHAQSIDYDYLRAAAGAARTPSEDDE